jgi:integrase
LKGIEVIKSKKSGDRYRAEVYVGRRRYRRTFKTEKEAITWKTTIQLEREKNRVHGITVNNALFFEDLCHFFLEAKAEIRKSSEKTYRSAILTHLQKPLGKKRLKDISLTHLDALKAKMIKEKHSPGGVNKIITLVNSIMKFGVTRGFVEKNPFEGYKKLKVDSQKYQYWEVHEIEQFLKQIASSHYFNVFLFALNTGMRRGEICGLLWENVLFISPTQAKVTFSEQLTPDGERQGLKGHLTRTLGLNELISEMLWMMKQETGYIFKDTRGNPINPNHLSRIWKEAQAEAGMKKIIKFHGARHSYASLLASKGTSLEKIAKILGHKDTKVTQVYSHLSQADIDRVVTDVKLGQIQKKPMDQEGSDIPKEAMDG